MARVGFKEGVVTTSDLLAAQTAWLAAQSDKIDAQIDIMTPAPSTKKPSAANIHSAFPLFAHRPTAPATVEHPYLHKSSPFAVEQQHPKTMRKQAPKLYPPRSCSLWQ